MDKGVNPVNIYITFEIYFGFKYDIDKFKVHYVK